MDAFMQKQPYRCLPLVIANTTGWELHNPVPFRATWNGGPNQADIAVEGPFHVPRGMLDQYVTSHFGGGVLTFHSHYLFKTPKEWDLWVGGPPNAIKHGIQALTGIVETSWLPQPFTMNWRFTQPGSVAFGTGEPFSFIMPVPHAAIDQFDPIVEDLSADPELEAKSLAWQRNRDAFIANTVNRDPTDASQAWQRHYFKGVNIDDTPGPEDHIHRRRLKAPHPPGDGE